jgi:hypothetical protein
MVLRGVLAVSGAQARTRGPRSRTVPRSRESTIDPVLTMERSCCFAFNATSSQLTIFRDASCDPRHTAFGLRDPQDHESAAASGMEAGGK